MRASVRDCLSVSSCPGLCRAIDSMSLANLLSQEAGRNVTPLSASASLIS